MNKICFLIFILLTTTMCSMNSGNSTIVLIETDMGNIKVKLYDETPLHKENFIKLVQEGSYNDKIFHRVIKDFMIQAGDTIKGDESNKLEDTISSEINFPIHYHKRGALAAARYGDNENPTKASSKDQFYIVTGETVLNYRLAEYEKQRFERLKQSIYSKLQSEQMDAIKAYYKEGNRDAIADLREMMHTQAEEEATIRKAETLYTDEQKEVYNTIGGTPFLDNEYTVFGEVVDGMEVVAKIEAAKTNSKDKPLQHITMKLSIID